MAGLTTYGGGLRRIEFGPDDDRRIIRLGRMPAKAARNFKMRIEAIIADLAANRPHDADTAAWLGGLDEKTLAKLRKAGLADGVGLSVVTLGAFLSRFNAAQTVKTSTRIFYSHTRRNLLDHFGPDRLLRDISDADADGWRAWLVDHEGLSAATVGRRVVAARSIWRKAVRWRLAASNPFDGVKGGHQANEARKRYISNEDIKRVLDAAPDSEWRAIIALARYGGLRTPSETFALRWSDINWERGTIYVTCPKQAHHEAYAARTIPLFPELRGPLLELFEAADEGGPEHVITRYRDPAQNLRTHLVRIVKRAGLTPWPKLFHNLRASRETELMRSYDLATVCRWLGNSPVVAARHYATSVDLDADFRRAAGLDSPVNEAHGKAQGKAHGSTPEQGGQGGIADTPLDAQPLAASLVIPPVHSCSYVDIGQNWALLDSNQ